MKHKDDQQLNDLYKNANQDQPSKQLDDLILQHAMQSEPSARYTKRRWQPWFAAASVLLAVPMIWLLTQNQQLVEQNYNSDPNPTEVSHPTPQPEPPAMPANDTGKYTNEPMEVPIVPKRSSIESATQPLTESRQADEESRKTSVTGEPINQQSLTANKKLLMDELKTKKRSLKRSNMTPMMALETAQFNEYVAAGNWQAAEQLLMELKTNWPDFDFSELAAQLNALKDQ